MQISSTKYYQTESNNTLKESYSTIIWDLSQGCNDSSISANQSAWYTTLTNWRMTTHASQYMQKMLLTKFHTHKNTLEMGIEGISVQFSCSVMSDSLQPHESQHTRPPCPSPTPGVHWDSHPSSQWCHPAILSSVVPFSSCPQSLPALESFPMSQVFICINIWYLFFWFTLLCNRLYIHPPH